MTIRSLFLVSTVWQPNSSLKDKKSMLHQSNNHPIPRIEVNGLRKISIPGSLINSLPWKTPIELGNSQNHQQSTSIKSSEILDSYYPGGWLPKLSKNNYRVRVELLGNIDVFGMANAVTESDLQAYLLRTQRNIENSQLSGQQVAKYKTILMMDCNSFFSQICNAFMKIWPGMIEKIYIIRCPKSFHIFYWTYKSLFIKEFRKKAVILPIDYHYQSVLVDELGAEVVPACYGGNLTDTNEDPNCSEWLAYPHKIPKYLYGKALPSLHFGTWKECSVGRKSVYDIDVEISVAGSTLRWEIVFQSNYINVGLYYKGTDKTNPIKKDEDAVIAQKTMKAKCTPTCDGCFCIFPGYCKLVVVKSCSILLTNVVLFLNIIDTLELDNSHSLLHSQKIWYCIQVVEPSVEEQRIYLNPFSEITNF
ncbi:SEC14-like protein 4 [Trichoplax sp. H2]|nr:SEC14-like protein 4 [Trichoplax sp. H2]|eukprot:RDD46455.1 SEC14-like protein 4 [Trichoplax sp. H2]